MIPGKILKLVEEDLEKLKTLPYREREVFKLRSGLQDGTTYTLEEIGRIFRITREGARQIELRAIRKLEEA